MKIEIACPECNINMAANIPKWVGQMHTAECKKCGLGVQIFRTTDELVTVDFYREEHR